MSKRILLPLFLFTFGLLGLMQQMVAAQSISAACVDDTLEENDTIAQATPIELGNYSPLAICENDDDYYAIDFPAGYEMEVQLTFNHAVGDLNVYILNTEQITIAQSSSSSDDEQVIVRLNNGGTHYIHVVGFQSAENNYSMSVDQQCQECISYQGKLQDSNSDANGDYEFVFTLFDSLIDGVQVGNTATRTITVDDGLFSSALYFGDIFESGRIYPQFLNIAVRPAGSAGSFTALAPRTELTAAPVALSLLPHTTISGTRSLSPTLVLLSRDSDGLRIPSVEFDGVQVDASGDNGIEVNDAGGHGVYAISTGLNRYGGYFVSNAISPATGYGVYARSNDNFVADITLGGNGSASSQDDGRISSDPFYTGSDIYLNPQDHLFVRLDTNGSNSSSFDIQDGNGLQAWSVDEGGNVTRTGRSVTTVESLSRGESVEMYGMSATENWFEDFGRSTLTDSRTIVQIDPLFAETVSLSADDYHVFLTPYGACSLYVAETSATSFTVQAIDPDCSIDFDYRIVGKRVGHEEMRMQPVQLRADETQETENKAVEDSGVVIDQDHTIDDEPSSVEESK